MVAMALGAFGPIIAIEGLFVFAAIEETGIGRMAKTATSAHPCDARRSSRVIAVASVARGRAQIAALEERAAMNTQAILCQLSRRQRRAIRAGESGHDFGIRVAGAAGFRHGPGINFGERIFCRPNTMDPMAAHALRGAAVMFLKKCPPMRTLLELRQLIGRQRGVELVHERGIGMAARAELHDPLAILLAILLRPFFHVGMTEIGGGIAAVTTGTRDSATKMNIFDDFLEVHVRR